MGVREISKIKNYTKINIALLHIPIVFLLFVIGIIPYEWGWMFILVWLYCSPFFLILSALLILEYTKNKDIYENRFIIMAIINLFVSLLLLRWFLLLLLGFTRLYVT